MRVVPAHINHHGLEQLLHYAMEPDRLTLYDGDEAPQIYLSGISVPHVPELRESFSIPIVGDNESYGISFSVDWPTKNDVAHYRRVAFVGMLIAEDWIPDIGTSTFSVTSDGEVSLRTDVIEEADWEYLGEFGGFLVAEALFEYCEGKPVINGVAEFVVAETLEEYQRYHYLLSNGEVSPMDIVGALRCALLLHDYEPSESNSSAQVAGQQSLFCVE